jgi:nucleoside-diphosphate-sugar epimerase
VGELSGRRAAVTGAGGFIGRAVCRRLIEEGASVAGLDLDPGAATRVEETGAEFALADVTDPDALRAPVSQADLVVHTAALVREWGPMADFVRVNVGGTANVLAAAHEAGVERVLHVSSVVVYGHDDPVEQAEDAYLRTCGVPYIDTKAASDALAARASAVVIRPGDVYGPGSPSWTLRPLAAAKLGQLAVPRGGGTMLPIYIDDLVEAIVLGIEHGKPGEAYTAWSGDAITFEEFFNRYAKMVGKPRTRTLPRSVLVAAGLANEAAAKLRRRPPLFGRHSVVVLARRGTVSNRKAREELGWQPRVDLNEGMRRTEVWLRTGGLA